MSKSMLFNHETVLTVGEFLEAVNMVLQDFEVVVRGEVSGLSNHPTGVYFSLQDEDKKALLQCYMPPFVYKAAGVALEDGMQVQVGGQASMYKPKGRFSFLVRTLELTGEGAIQKAYELLKKQLKAQGLFDRKRSVPSCISRIALVTSATGAVQADFRNNLIKRGIKIDLYNVLVEGSRATADIVGALQRAYARASHYDVVVLVRGGGSLEDLQAFNSELVAKTLFASPIPTICAIGHDRDTPIAQLVADVSPSTPTAAAGVVNQTWEQSQDQLVRMTQELVDHYQDVLTRAYYQLSQASFTCSTFFAVGTRHVRELQIELLNTFGRFLESFVRQVHTADALLTAVDPKKILKMGYSVTRTATGAVVRSISEVKSGDVLSTLVSDGSISSTVQTSSNELV